MMELFIKTMQRGSFLSKNLTISIISLFAVICNVGHKYSEQKQKRIFETTSEMKVLFYAIT